jgi:sugar lactone lactonase YvrE
VNVSRVGDVHLTWGESVRWDDRRGRLYAVDCATQHLHWLEGGEPPLHGIPLPSLPTGVVLTEGDELVVCLGDGLHAVDPSAGTTELLAPYPDGMHGRANDAHADLDGNLVTGTLNVGPGPGALWWWSSSEGWRLLDESFGNANGPAALDGTLVCGDTVAAAVFAYDYDGRAGSAAARRLFSDHAALGGAPDGATVDDAGGVWSCVLRAGRVARLTADGPDRVVDLPVTNPSDVAFGGPGLDRLFVASIALDLGDGVGPGPQGGALLAVDGLGVRGRPEPRLRLSRSV